MIDRLQRDLFSDASLITVGYRGVEPRPWFFLLTLYARLDERLDIINIHVQSTIGEIMVYTSLMISSYVKTKSRRR